MRWLKIPLGVRLFIVYFFIMVLTAYVVNSVIIRELRPALKNTTEESLIDTANILASLAEKEWTADNTLPDDFINALNEYGQRYPHDRLNPNSKDDKMLQTPLIQRVYVTNQQGIVIADSWQQDVGQDFSQWNDVYLTLQGRYGARSTQQFIDDPNSSIMHIAAPIYAQGEIVGSLTVAKATRSIQPMLEWSRKKIIEWLALISILVLGLGALFSWRTHAALHKLENYAEKTGKGEMIAKPKFRIFYEYATLSDALEKMRNQLDGKQYVEHYVETLTHELKSPLSAIKGASEILQTPLETGKITRFAKNIERESNRMQSLIDKLLELARLEKRPELNVKALSLNNMVNDVIKASESKQSAKGVTCHFLAEKKVEVLVDEFLFKQALFNLMENALDFVDEQGEIHWTLSIEKSPHNTDQAPKHAISIFNTGPHIPDFALKRLTERFYSLPRKNGQKSTGLGLNFVEQVVKMHGFQLIIENVEGGVKVSIVLA